VKRLYILRHAKAENPTSGGEDRERALAGKGKQDTRHMRDLLHKEVWGNGSPPDLVLCSDARRTRETWEILRSGPDFSPKSNPDRTLHMSFEKDLYLADLSTLTRRIRRTEDTTQALLLIGHNPGLQDLVLQLTTGTISPARAQVAESFPTAAFAALHFPITTWKNICTTPAELAYLLTPASRS